MPNRLLTSRLAAKAGIRKVESLSRCDRIALQIDRLFAAAYQEMLRGLADTMPPQDARKIVQRAFAGIWANVYATYEREFLDLAEWSHADTADDMTRTLPAMYLRAAALGKVERGGKSEWVNLPIQRGPLREDVADDAVARLYTVRNLADLDKVIARFGRLSKEDVAEIARKLGIPEGSKASMLRAMQSSMGGRLPPRTPKVEIPPPGPQPGIITFTQANGTLGILDSSERLKEPAFDTLPMDEQKAAYKELLFPPPSRKKTLEIIKRPVGGVDWDERLQMMSRLASPEVLASRVANGYAAGMTRQQIVKELTPLVNGVKSSARRVARTQGMAIANTMQMDAYADAGDIIEGYQHFSTLDQFARPWHAARNGRIYYKRPKPGQSGLYQMANPPMEPDDPNERPSGEPKLARNCRCVLVAVLVPPESIVNDPAKMAVFKNNSSESIPDPLTYSDWFAKSPEEKQRLAVGGRRWSVAKEKHGRAPEWADFLDPETGGLLTRDALEAETPKAAMTRRGEVQALIRERGELVRKAQTYGFIPPDAGPRAVAQPSQPTITPEPRRGREPVSEPEPTPKPVKAKPEKPTKAAKEEAHPLAGLKTNQEKIDKLADAYGRGRAPATSDNPDPWELRKTKPSQLAAGLAGDVTAAVARQQSENAFKRLDLAELYVKLKAKEPKLSKLDYQRLLTALHGENRIRLGPYTQTLTSAGDLVDFLMPLDREFKGYVGAW